MKLCDYHLDDLRTKLQHQGVAPGDGPKAPIHSAHSALLALCMATEPGLLGSPGCPICTLMMPSLIDRAARGLAQSLREGMLPQHEPRH